MNFLFGFLESVGFWKILRNRYFDASCIGFQGMSLDHAFGLQDPLGNFINVLFEGHTAFDGRKSELISLDTWNSTKNG